MLEFTLEGFFFFLQTEQQRNAEVCVRGQQAFLLSLVRNVLLNIVLVVVSRSLAGKLSERLLTSTVCLPFVTKSRVYGCFPGLNRAAFGLQAEPW